ncbi:MAG: GntR family transcriptional regulator [Hydrogenoanaerobacterium sp.]
MNIKLQTESDLPLYQQLVEAVSLEITSGELSPGSKLPTVRELADEMGLARGTIKHAYDELGKLGLIEMTQGRGTFVLTRDEAAQTGKKERAMNAIDALITELEGLSFTAREMQIFFGLKLREREEHYDNVRIAIVDCNPEALSLISNQLSGIDDVDVYKFLLSDILHSPHRLGDSADLIITTSAHFDELSRVVSDEGKMMRMVLSPTGSTIMELAKIKPTDEIGIFCDSEIFANIICKGCRQLEWRATPEVRLFGETRTKTSEFMAKKDVIIVPLGYMQFCSPDEGVAIRRAKAEGKIIIQYEYQIDGGSLLYLKEQIDYVRKQKKGK